MSDIHQFMTEWTRNAARSAKPSALDLLDVDKVVAVVSDAIDRKFLCHDAVEKANLYLKDKDSNFDLTKPEEGKRLEETLEYLKSLAPPGCELVMHHSEGVEVTPGGPIDLSVSFNYELYKG